jgi:hypothetical protein
MEVVIFDPQHGQGTRGRVNCIGPDLELEDEVDMARG